MKLPPIAGTQQIQLLQRICTKQDIPFETSALSYLVQCGVGDIRYVLNTLHSLVLSYGKITNAILKTSFLSKKDTIQSLQDYFSLIFLSAKTIGLKKKSNASNLTSIFSFFHDIHHERVIDGILEYIPTNPIPDPNLQRYSSALDDIIEYSIIHQFIKKQYLKFDK